MSRASFSFVIFSARLTRGGKGCTLISLLVSPLFLDSVRTHYFYFLFFFSFISLIADGPHHCHPPCGHKGSSHLSSVHALQLFYRDASSALLQLVNQWLNFTYSRSHAFRYERKNTNPTLVRIELTASVLAGAAYLLDHSGDERLLQLIIYSNNTQVELSLKYIMYRNEHRRSKILRTLSLCLVRSLVTIHVSYLEIICS